MGWIWFWTIDPAGIEQRGGVDSFGIHQHCQLFRCGQYHGLFPGRQRVETFDKAHLQWVGRASQCGDPLRQQSQIDLPLVAFAALALDKAE